MFLSLDLLWEYRIQHGPLYVTSSYLDILQGSFRLCNWLSLRRLVSWINHLPPACWSTFWKSNFKQQLGCRFDIMDNISYFFVFWHMQLHMYWYIRSFFSFTFLNIFYFIGYSCTDIFHRRSLCTFCLSSKVLINHFYQMKARPECLNILLYWSKYWVDRLRRTLRRKVKQEYFINRCINFATIINIKLPISTVPLLV